jgi:photosystem II stability/assembly factor-like uncharacterized protein
MILRRSCLTLAAVLLAMLALTQSSAAAEPRWAPLGPPAAPLAARLVVEPGNGNRAYAFNAAGLWLSRDDADSWRSIQVGLGRAPQAFTFDPFRPGRLYAVALDVDFTATVYRSDDFGNRWTPVFRSGQAFSGYTPQLLADPFAKDTLLWINNYNLYRSRDAGRTWNCVPVRGAECVQSVQPQTFAFAPDRPKTLYVLEQGGGGFHVSRDDGRTWTTSFLTVPYLDTLVATREPRTLYAWTRNANYRGALTACFARSDDEGETWKGILADTKCGAPAVDPDDPRTVRMVVVYNRVPQLWVSRNGGDTWTSPGAVPEFGDLYVVPGGGLALATDKGFFRAPGDQGPWRAANRGFAASHVGAVLPVEEAVLAAPVVSEDGLKPPSVSLLRTEDGGRSWESEPLNNPLALAADPSDPLHLIASAVRYDESYSRHFRVLESRDGGHTWRGVVDPQATHPWATALAIDPFLPQTFYAGAGPTGGLYRSDDAGRTWRHSNAGLPRPSCHHRFGCAQRQVHTILTDSTRPGRMFIRLNNSIYRSLDYGIIWTQLRTHQGPAGESVYALARDLQGALIVIGGGSRAGDNVSLGVAYRSTDNGASWTRLGRLPSSPPNGFANEITGLAATQGALWVSVRFLGVFRSTDGGATWKSANEGLPLLSVTSLVTDPEDPARLFVTIPGHGIYTLAAP